jgi:hypothetical protein
MEFGLGPPHWSWTDGPSSVFLLLPRCFPFSRFIFLPMI